MMRQVTMVEVVGWQIPLDHVIYPSYTSVEVYYASQQHLNAPPFAQKLTRYWWQKNSPLPELCLLTLLFDGFWYGWLRQLSAITCRYRVDQ